MKFSLKLHQMIWTLTDTYLFMHTTHNILSSKKKVSTIQPNKILYHVITKMVNILQWNLNGFFKKQEELELIIQKHDPQIICLQETNFKDNYTTHLKNYVRYSKNRRIADRASGRVTIYSKSNISTKELKINSNLKTLAVSIQHNETFTLCNIYLPNQTDFSLSVGLGSCCICMIFLNH
jgi:hypothetical protein